METTKDSSPATSSLIALPPEERRNILLESLQEGYPSIPGVSRPVSSRVSRYVSQFTSGRWRERIWFSDESVDSEDLEKEMSTSGRGEPQLVLFGHNLHSEDYLKEREMMARWNIVERELHFPDLEKGYVQKRDAKTQSDAVLQPNIQTSTTKDSDVVTEPTEGVPMEECKESPQKVTEDNENSPTGRGLKSSVTEDSPTGRGLKPSGAKDDENSPTGRGLKSSVTEDDENSPTGRGLKSSGTKDDENSPTGRGLKSSVGSDQTPKTKDADVVTEPTTEDVPMEECKESPQKVTEDNENSPTGRGLKSSATEDSPTGRGLKSSATEDSPTGRGLKSSATEDSPTGRGLKSSVTEDSPTGRGLKSSVTEDENSPTGRGLKSSATEDSPTGRGLKSSVTEDSPTGRGLKSSVTEDSPTGRGLKSSVTEDSPTGRGLKSSVTEDDENSPTGRGLKSSVGSGELHSKVEEMQDQSIKSKKCKINEGQSVYNRGSSVSKDLKEVSAVPDPKLAKRAKTETSDAESGAKTSDPNSKSSALLEAKESVEKMEASTIPEDSSVESSAKVLETPATTSTGEKSVPAAESSKVPKVEGPADEMDTESVPEQMNVERTSETDAEATGTNLRGKRKADSVTEDDPVEKRTKKTSAE